MTKAEIREASSDDLRARVADVNKGLRRYIPFERVIIDTQQDKNPELLQELIWIQNELTRRGE